MADGRALDQYRVHSQQHADAANAILSYVCDKFFQIPVSLVAIAKELGYTTLMDSPHFEDPKQMLLDFFVEVCQAPDLGMPEAKRFTGPGWKLIRKSDDTELCTLWQELCDEGSWTTSRRIKEKSWQELLGCSEPVRVDINDNKTNVVVRFATGPLKVPSAVNGSIAMSPELKARL